MAAPASRAEQFFFEVFESLLRQGPGGLAWTARAGTLRGLASVARGRGGARGSRRSTPEDRASLGGSTRPIPPGVDLSVGTLVASIVVSAVGMGLFVYGKKQVRVPQLVVGLAMMGFPYVASGAAAIWGLGAALAVALAVALRAGL